jgi:hypothetical protein
MHHLKTASLFLATAAAFACASGAHAAAGRVIDITPDTRAINVTQGEIVTLRMDDATFTWQVDAPVNLNAIPLAQVAPAARGQVTVYIAPGPRYQAG